MKSIESYVCTLEQAKKLKRLLVTKEPLFYWVENEKEGYRRIINEQEWLVFLGTPIYFYSAFTSQELGELINETEKYIIFERVCLNIYRFSKLDYSESNFTDTNVIAELNAENEAQARAEFLIYLLERNEEAENA